MEELLEAIESGDVGRVREAVRLCPVRDDLSEALFRAVEVGNLAIVRTLLEAGADPNYVDEPGDLTCLMQAVEKGHPPIVRALVGAGADVNAVTDDEDGDDGFLSPLLIAVRGRRQAIAEFLLPMTEPEERERVERIGRSIVARPDRKSAALIRAGESGDLERARALLSEGADVNARDRRGATALNNATAYGHAPLVRLLLEAGADPDLRTNEGVAPLMCAPDEEIGRLLVEAGAEVNAEQHGFTALMAAAIHGRCALLRLLIDAGAGIEAAEFRGYTPLMLACRHGRREAVAALIEAGADVNRAKDGGWTALMEAAGKPDAEVVRMLLAAGARTDAVDDQGRTPPRWPGTGPRTWRSWSRGRGIGDDNLGPSIPQVCGTMRPPISSSTSRSDPHTATLGSLLGRIRDRGVHPDEFRRASSGPTCPRQPSQRVGLPATGSASPSAVVRRRCSSSGSPSNRTLRVQGQSLHSG